MPSIFDELRSTVRNESEVAVSALFPTRNRFEMLQMISDLPPRSIVPFTIMGLFRRRFKSKVLQWYHEEYAFNRIADARKGRLELGEIMGALRRKDSDDEE